MNKRVKELALLAGFTSYDRGELQSPYVEYSDISELLDTFAELIVRECAEAAADVVGQAEGVDFGLVEECYKHFGIEK